MSVHVDQKVILTSTPYKVKFVDVCAKMKTKVANNIFLNILKKEKNKTKSHLRMKRYWKEGEK